MNIRASTSTDDSFGVSDRRQRAAAVLRRRGDGFARHDAPDEPFEQLVNTIVLEVEQPETRKERNRALVASSDGDGLSLFGESPSDGARLSHTPDCVVSGVANPMDVAIEAHREAGDAVGETVLGAAFEGAPGRAHGVVAAIFDRRHGIRAVDPQGACSCREVSEHVSSADSDE